MKPRTDTPESKALWDFVEKKAKQVQSWPAWKKMGVGTQPEEEYYEPPWRFK